jgi:hypothetical protein
MKDIVFGNYSILTALVYPFGLDSFYNNPHCFEKCTLGNSHLECFGCAKIYAAGIFAETKIDLQVGP